MSMAGSRSATDHADMAHALALVTLEGPSSVRQASLRYSEAVSALARGVLGMTDDVAELHADFLQAAQDALAEV